MQFIFYFLSSTPFFLSDKSPPIYSSAQVDIIISIQPKSRVYTHTHTHAYSWTMSRGMNLECIHRVTQASYDERCRSFGLHGGSEGSYGSTWRMQLRITRAGVIVRTMPGLLLVILSRHCTIVSCAILNREIKAKVE